MHQSEFKYPRWAGLTALGAAAVSLFVSYLFRTEVWWLPVFFVCFGLLWIVAFFEMATSYIDLQEDRLVFRMNFKKTAINKKEIQKVTWEKGCGVAIQLTSGEWIPLPGLGKSSQGTTNSIRAWLKRKDARENA